MGEGDKGVEGCGRAAISPWRGLRAPRPLPAAAPRSRPPAAAATRAGRRRSSAAAPATAAGCPGAPARPPRWAPAGPCTQALWACPATAGGHGPLVQWVAVLPLALQGWQAWPGPLPTLATRPRPWQLCRSRSFPLTPLPNPRKGPGGLWRGYTYDTVTRWPGSFITCPILIHTCGRSPRLLLKRRPSVGGDGVEHSGHGAEQGVQH